MTAATDERSAIVAIGKIITQQKALEKHQRRERASVNTLQDSMVYAYDQIIEVMQAFMEDQQ